MRVSMQSLRVSVVMLATVAMTWGCGSPNTTRGDGGDAGDVRGTQDGTFDGVNPSDGSADGADAPSTVDGDSGGNADTTASECTMASDCDTAFGASPCGSWACNGGRCQASSAGCSDDDFDGYGTGAGCTCAGLDCDDHDDTVAGTAAGTCYSGPAGTQNVGTCVAGTRRCNAGVWTPCSGEVTPSGEACNGLDDDCDGTRDDGLGTFTCGLGACANTVPACAAGVVGICVPLSPAANEVCGDTVDNNCNGVVNEGCSSACVPVAPGGNDTTAGALSAPATATPFATIQAAITWAAAHPAWTTVCVAGGATCGATANYPANVTMSNGVSVLGSYESTGWTQCAAITTTIRPQGATGVSFPSMVQRATVLDHFQIDRFAASTTAAVTVDGARNVTLANLVITANALSASIANTYGVNVVNGGSATITRDRVEAGLGMTEAVAVRAVGSVVHLINNCGTINAQGRCGSSSGPTPTSPGLRHGNGGAGATYGVFLQNSPASTIETTGIQMGNADVGAGVRIVGDATGVVLRGNNVFVFDGVTDSHGVWMEDCGGAAPWLVNNELISGNGSRATSRADGVRAIGDCHPVIDSNVRLQGGGEGNAAFPNGVHCGANATGTASRCVVLNNQLISGSQFGFPPQVTGVRCDGGSCLRIAGNTITARGATTGYGVWLESTGVMLDDNEIRGGCSATAYGVYSSNSYARVQNNRIFGFTASDCPAAGGVTSMQSTGLALEIASGRNEVDVNGNDIDGGGNPVACTSRGVSVRAGTPAPTGGVGILRNNIVRAGRCTMTRYGVEETAAGTDPRIFENNNLDPFGTPTALYFDEAATPVASAAGVNALTGMVVAGTLSADSLYVSYPTDLHIAAGSPCIGAGTSRGAAAFDMDGDARDPSAPDIGADEH